MTDWRLGKTCWSSSLDLPHVDQNKNIPGSVTTCARKKRDWGFTWSFDGLLALSGWMVSPRECRWGRWKKMDGFVTANSMHFEHSHWPSRASLTKTCGNWRTAHLVLVGGRLRWGTHWSARSLKSG
jgi:hypothetical protein